MVCIVIILLTRYCFILISATENYYFLTTDTESLNYSILKKSVTWFRY